MGSLHGASIDGDHTDGPNLELLYPLGPIGCSTASRCQSGGAQSGHIPMKTAELLILPAPWCAWQPTTSPADRPVQRVDANSAAAHTQLLEKRSKAALTSTSKVIRLAPVGPTDYPDCWRTGNRISSAGMRRTLDGGAEPGPKHPHAAGEWRIGQASSQGHFAAGEPIMSGTVGGGNDEEKVADVTKGNSGDPAGVQEKAPEATMS